MTNDNIFSVCLPSCTNQFLAAICAINLAILFGMSKLQRQETQHGEEDARGVDKSRPTRDLSLWLPIGLQTCRVRALLCTAGENKSKLLKFGSAERRETRDNGFEREQLIKFSSVVDT